MQLVQEELDSLINKGAVVEPMKALSQASFRYQRKTGPKAGGQFKGSEPIRSNRSLQNGRSPYSEAVGLTRRLVEPR